MYLVSQNLMLMQMVYSQNISDITDTRRLGQQLSISVIALKMREYKRRF